jgi:hypothetical protein
MNKNFRGKKIDTKEWVFGNGVVIVDSDYVAIPHTKDVTSTDYSIKLCKIIPNTLGQCTGINIRYKNNTPPQFIYEGDIVNDSIRDYIVRWNTRTARFELEIIYHEAIEGIVQTHKDFPIDGFLLNLKGNIHDNPELLPQKS